MGGDWSEQEITEKREQMGTLLDSTRTSSQCPLA